MGIYKLQGNIRTKFEVNCRNNLFHFIAAGVPRLEWETNMCVSVDILRKCKSLSDTTARSCFFFSSFHNDAVNICWMKHYPTLVDFYFVFFVSSYTSSRYCWFAKVADIEYAQGLWLTIQNCEISVLLINFILLKLRLRSNALRWVFLQSCYAMDIVVLTKTQKQNIS